MAEIEGEWNGGIVELRLEGNRLAFVGEDGTERRTLYITDHGPAARADGSKLIVGNQTIEIKAPNAVGKAAGLATQIESIRWSSTTRPSRPEPRTGPAPSTQSTPVLGVVLAIVGVVMMVLGAVAGGNLVSQTNEELVFDNLDFAEAVTVFGGGASAWLIAGAVLLGSGLIVHRLDQGRS